MKYLIALVLGLASGALLGAALLVFNPTVKSPGLSPLEVNGKSLLRLSYSGVTEASIAYTNNGESAARPYPSRILQLWEAPIRKTDLLVARLQTARGEFAGLGIKFMSDSESSSLVHGQALVDSDWHVVMPGRGTLFVSQSENYWSYLKGVVLPAYRSSAKSWKGVWNGNITAGPGALGTGRVVGGSGEFAGRESEAVEMLSARAYSSRTGPVSLDGTLILDIAVSGERVVSE